MSPDGIDEKDKTGHGVSEVDSSTKLYGHVRFARATSLHVVA